MSLLPPHIQSSEASSESYRFVADRVRAFRTPHCNSVFMGVVHTTALARERDKLSRDMFLVDVGAHLGDCCLWAIARWPWVKCTAIERNPDVAANIQRSISLGNLADRVDV